jgi:Uma2 family endonuclease
MASTMARKTRQKSPMNGSGGMPPDIARLISAREYWTEEEFLALDDNIGAWMIELVNGRLEFPVMPDIFHQNIVIFLLFRFHDFVVAHSFGEVIQAPLPIKLGKLHYREPDIAYFKPHRIKNRRSPPQGADLVVEVLMPGEDARRRDLVDKPVAYAAARIREYWIVDPEQKTITVLTLSGSTYKVHGVFKLGEFATSKLLKGFKVAVSDVFAAGKGK